MSFALQSAKVKNYIFPLTRLYILSLLMVSLLGCGQSSSGLDVHPPVYAHDPPRHSNAELVRRGEYLAKAGNCLACHTNATDGGRAYAGGLPLKTSFGTYFSPNITPDKKTGIGNWTDAQFMRAMRQGIAPDGSNYFPVFPYNSFSNLTDADLRALKAYLMSIPPVAQKNKESTAPWPFNWRFAQWGWKILFQYDQGVFKPNPKKSPQWNRGAYLVEGLAHCGECHTPRNFLGGMKQKYALTGAMVGGSFAPNISAPALKDYSIQDTVNVFAKGEKLGGRGKVGGSMAEVNAMSLQHLSQSDLEAIAIYIKSVNSVQPQSKHGNGKISLEDAKNSYEENCAVCHDVGAAGAPKLADSTYWAARVKQHGLNKVYDNAIYGLNAMPAMGGCVGCSQNEIKAVVRYMLIQAEKSKK